MGSDGLKLHAVRRVAHAAHDLLRVGDGDEQGRVVVVPRVVEVEVRQIGVPEHVAHDVERAVRRRVGPVGTDDATSAE